jgi:hypothetical protein
VCRISPGRLSEIEPPPQILDPECGRAILDAVFKLLPQLTNLIEVDLDSVHLTEDNMKQMSSIPHLNTVFMAYCSTTSPPIHLAVQTVLVKTQYRFAPFHQDDPSRLLSSLLQPDTVQHLCVVGDSVSAAFSDISRLPPLHCLRTLCINCSAPMLSSFVRCLSQLPILCEIILRTHKTFSPIFPSALILPSCAIPFLQAYEGPFQLARSFCQGRPVRHLKLCGTSRVDDLLNNLRLLQSNSTLDSLEIDVCRVDKILLNGLFDERLRFSEIKALDITFDFMDVKVN